MLNDGLSGYSLVHSDIGGYTTLAEKVTLPSFHFYENNGSTHNNNRLKILSLDTGEANNCSLDGANLQLSQSSTGLILVLFQILTGNSTVTKKRCFTLPNSLSFTRAGSSTETFS